MTVEATSAERIFDPYDYVTQEDPYPTYRWMRDEAPLYFNEEHDFYALSRHADVSAAVRDDTTFGNSYGVSLDPSAWNQHAHTIMSFLALDAPRHTRLRSLVSRGFTPRRVREMEPTIRRLTIATLEPALAKGSFDWIDDFAGILPMDVISELMGVPHADRQELRRLADLVVHRQDGLRDVPPEGVSASLELVSYYANLLAEKRKKPADDLTSALLQAEIDGDRLEEGEIIAFMFLMVVAGNETTTKLFGNAVLHAWRNPAELAKPMNDVARVPDWIEETLRFDTSSQLLARHVTKDVELHGRVVPAGSRMALLFGSANHDERVFTDPTTYNLDRDPTELSQLISFGAGRHFCLGANLARLEARVGLEELVNRVKSIEVHEGGIERVRSVSVRGLAHLPVTMEAR
jgi:hypothetical protein